MKIALLVEGTSDEKTIPLLIQKISGTQASVVPRVLKGRWDLLNPRKVYATISHIFRSHADISKIVVCVDLECAKDSGTEKSEIRNTKP